MSGDSVLGRPVLERALFLLKGEDLFSQSSPDSFCPLAIWAGVMRLAVISLTIGAVGSLCAAARTKSLAPSIFGARVNLKTVVFGWAGNFGAGA